LALAKKLTKKVDRIGKLKKRFVIGPKGKKLVSIGPTLEGRIKSLYP